MNTLIALVEPLEFAFFRRGLAVAVLAGALCGFIGVFVVLRSMSYIGHGLSHAVFGGAAVASVIGVSYFAAAGLWGVLAAVLIGKVAARQGVGADAAIGVVTTASFAFGLAVQSRSGSADGSLDAVLFGNVLGVFGRDVVAVAVAGVAIVAFVVAYKRELTFATFDPTVARTTGINVALFDALLMVAVSGAVLVSVRVIGALLISAMLVLPAATARMLTDSLDRMLVIAPILGGTFGLVGMYVSWYADVPSGATITLIGATAFTVTFLATDVARRRAVAAVDEHSALA